METDEDLEDPIPRCQDRLVHSLKQLDVQYVLEGCLFTIPRSLTSLMDELTTACEVLHKSERGCVLQFIFKGRHDWRHGPQMMQYMERMIFENETVRAIVINLLDYSYEFGNDLFGLFMIGFDQKSQRLRPVCVLSRGRTQASLKSLLHAAHVESVFDVTFVSTTEEVADWLRSKNVHSSA